MLLKLLLLALAIWLLLLRQYRRSVDEAPGAQPEAPEDMVCCAFCGVHLPKSESIFKQGAYYCCEEHSNQSNS